MKKKFDREIFLRWPALPAVIMCIVFFFINVFCTNGFLPKHIILSFLSSNIPLICVSIGCACVIISGGMDISLGSIVSLTNVILVKLNAAGLSLTAQIIICLTAALLMGLINGIVIGWLRVTPLLATMPHLPFTPALPCGSCLRLRERWQRYSASGITAGFLVCFPHPSCWPYWPSACGF